MTTEQDKSIIEANAAGIRSSRYEPGPSSLLEYDLDGFREWYLGVTGSASRLPTAVASRRRPVFRHLTPLRS